MARFIASSVRAFPAIPLALLLAFSSPRSSAHDEATPGHAGHALGSVHLAVSCTPAAQRAFDHALALLHHMTYPQARTEFADVAKLDPKCAMAHWGVATTLFQPLWPTRPNPAQLAQGHDEMERAKALAPATKHEQLLVDATAAFFADPAATDYWARIDRWAGALARAHDALPDEDEITVLHALALLATMPADRISRENADRAAALLLDVRARQPDHPGVMHYLVHANDVPGRERESLDVTHHYEEVAPDNPHALHMPTHIYTRLGDWEGVVRGNLRAADAALAHPAGEHGEWVWDEFPHAIEYLVYAYLQQGDDESALRQLERLHGTANLEPSFKTAFHLVSTKARYALEREDWKAAAAIVAREPGSLAWDRFGWPESIAWFAHGLGALRTGDDAGAREAEARIAALAKRASEAGEPLFARSIEVLRLELHAWNEDAAGERDAAIATMREAASLEASTPKHAVTPGPTLPAPEQLGELLLAAQRPKDALTAFEASLALYPRRFHSLLGAARAARASGDAAAAKRWSDTLHEVASPASKRAALRE